MRWHQSKRITYEHYEVDPATWADKRPLLSVAECRIVRDRESDLLGGATMSVGELVGSEMYVRSYLVAEQPVGSGSDERVCLGTHLVQAPRLDLDGKSAKRALTAYTPLAELRRGLLPLLYTVPAGADAVAAARAVCARWCRAPVVSSGSHALDRALTADGKDTPLSFLRTLLDLAGMELSVDPFGRLVFAPVVPTRSMRPAWTYSDEVEQLMFPDVSEGTKWADTPNYVEVVFGGGRAIGRAWNEEEGNPLSVQARGEVGVREDGPERNVTQAEADAYAAARLAELSCDERTVEYSHGYCPVTVGDCVALDYAVHGYAPTLRVTRQEIDCGTSSCKVRETAKHTVRMWES